MRPCVRLHPIHRSSLPTLDTWQGSRGWLSVSERRNRKWCLLRFSTEHIPDDSARRVFLTAVRYVAA